MESTKKNQNGNNNGTNASNQGTTKAPLKDRLQKRWDTFRATKGGRWAIRGAKAAAILTALGVTYKAGQRHPEIKENTPESEQQKLEAPIEETPTEEAPAAEPAVEEETI